MRKGDSSSRLGDRDTPRRNPARDQRGAVMLLGVFISVFLTAALYHIVGIGEAIAHREQMQDAADAVALSSAGVLARGMNTIVLINLLMAAILAVLVALKLVETALVVAMAVMVALGPLYPAALALVPVAEEARRNVREVHDELKEPVHDALESLNMLARGVKVSVPWVAQLHMPQSIARHYSPPVQLAFSLPARTSLPTTNGDFDELCGRSGQLIGELAEAILPGKVLDGVVRDALGDLTQGGADWFCGGEGSPPYTEQEYEVKHPELPSRQACNPLEIDPEVYDVDAHRETCAQASDDEQRSQPDPGGACRQDCGPEGPYAQRARMARRTCAPDAGERYDFTWQRQRWSLRVGWMGDSWRALEAPVLLDSRLMSDTARPCGGRDAVVDAGWEHARFDERGDPLPVCSDFSLPKRRGRARAERTVRYVTVSEIFSCKEQVRRRFEVAEDMQGSFDATASSQDRSKAHQALLDDVQLGEEPFQVRALAVGELPRSGPEGVVGIAAWGASEESPYLAARELGKLAFAQAEYYYDVQDAARPARQSWMWNMRWRARLRRFRPPEGGAGETDDPAAARAFQSSAPATDWRAACQLAVSAFEVEEGTCDLLDGLWLGELSQH